MARLECETIEIPEQYFKDLLEYKKRYLAMEGIILNEAIEPDEAISQLLDIV